MDISDFAIKQLELLAIERTADITQQTTLLTQLPPTALVRHGLALTNLLPSSQRTGFGGRTIVELEPDSAINSTGILPPHGIRQGDIVRIEPQPSGSATKKEKAESTAGGVEGVVHRVFEGRIAVAIEDDNAVDRVWSGKRLWVVKVANEITFKRMEKVVGILKEIGEKEGGREGLVDVLFGRRAPREVEAGYKEKEVKWFDAGLNESQKEAVKFALSSEEVGVWSCQCKYSLGIDTDVYSTYSWAPGNWKNANFA
jgi:DNA polymerase alpha-associated DNA helicase A